MNLLILKRTKQQGYNLLVNEPTYITARFLDQISIKFKQNFLSNMILNV